MNFWQRFRFFLVGFIPGCIILIFIINKKGCTSPNELKMQELQFQTIGRVYIQGVVRVQMRVDPIKARGALRHH